MTRPNLSQLVAGKLRHAILNEEYKAGQKLPSEQQLCEDFDVSRTTIRSALGHLEALGLVVTKRGSGTYVSEQSSVTSGLEELDSITDSIRRSGKTPSVEYDSITKRPALPEECEYMDVPHGTMIVELRRELKGDGVTIAYSYDAILADILPDDFNYKDLGIQGSIFAFFRNKLGIFPHSSVAEVHAVSSQHVGWGEEGNAHDLFVLLKQLHYNSNKELLIYSKTYFIEGRYTFTIKRSVTSQH